jgi:spore coat protein U-like protein
LKTGAKILAFLLAAGMLYLDTAGAGCTVTTTPVNFGNYNPFYLVREDSTGTIMVSCTAPSLVTISVGPSPNTGGFTPRKMKLASGLDLLTYNLYTTPALTAIWGDGTQSTYLARQLVRKHVPWQVIVFGSIPPGQDVSVGYYGETLVVNLNY